MVERDILDILFEVSPQTPEKLVEDFSRRRDNAQYLAALQNWESGDPRGCKELVDKLLARNSKHKEARQLLADLHLEQGDYQAAKAVLDQLLTDFPNDAHIHHSLGLLFETMNDVDASLRHLHRAVELEPENEFYQVCFDTTLATRQSRLSR